MKATPFRLYSATELQDCSDRVSKQLGAWLNEWFIDSKNVDKTVNVTVTSALASKAAHVVDQPGMLTCRSDQGTCLLFSVDRKALLSAFLGKAHDLPAGSAESDALVFKSIEALTSMCLGSLGKCQNAEKGSDLSQAYRNGSGWLSVNCKIADLEFVILFDASASLQLVPIAAPPKKGNLSPMGPCIADGRLKLSAEIGTADLSIGELKKLNVGDVITLDQLCSESIKVNNDEGVCCLTGHLGQSNGFKAIQLIKSGR